MIADLNWREQETQAVQSMLRVDMDMAASLLPGIEFYSGYKKDIYLALVKHKKKVFGDLTYEEGAECLKTETGTSLLLRSVYVGSGCVWKVHKRCTHPMLKAEMVYLFKDPKTIDTKKPGGIKITEIKDSVIPSKYVFLEPPEVTHFHVPKPKKFIFRCDNTVPEERSSMERDIHRDSVETDYWEEDSMYRLVTDEELNYGHFHLYNRKLLNTRTKKVVLSMKWKRRNEEGKTSRLDSLHHLHFRGSGKKRSQLYSVGICGMNRVVLENYFTRESKEIELRDTIYAFDIYEDVLWIAGGLYCSNMSWVNRFKIIDLDKFILRKESHFYLQDSREADIMQVSQMTRLSNNKLCLLCSPQASGMPNTFLLIDLRKWKKAMYVVSNEDSNSEDTIWEPTLFIGDDINNRVYTSTSSPNPAFEMIAMSIKKIEDWETIVLTEE